LSAGYVALVLVHLHFPEAGSLKAKRKELSSLKAQLTGRLGVSVSEVDHHDLWQRATLAVAATSSSATGAAESADRIERFVEARHPEGVRFERAITAFQELL
jgi:uncharacterized protein YlxP (DUF503 family)